MAGLFVQTLLTPTPYGDLARIGRISDRDFGWRADQPPVEPKLLQGAPVEAADILVIGDSFSATHVWQSRLTKVGYGVATVFWDSIDELLCGDFDGWLAASGFRGKLVIVESVERIVAIRMRHAEKCDRMAKPLASRSVPRATPPQAVPGFALNWDGQIFSGWLTARCTRAALAGRADSKCNPQTVAMQVPQGCDRFTHRRCEKALFLADDRNLGEVTPEHATQMQAFSDAHAGIPILWMIVPNKWTTYLEPAHSRAFAKALVEKELGPDLFDFALAQKTAMRDFYYPNDTHISTEGQLALGERMLQAVQEKLGRAASSGG